MTATLKKYIIIEQHEGEATTRRHIMRLATDGKARRIAALRVRISSRSPAPIISWTLYLQHIDKLGKRLFIIDAGEFSDPPVEVDPIKIKRATDPKKIFKRATSHVR